MKFIKKFVALTLILAVCAMTLASCGGEKSETIASFGVYNYIYEDDADFSDFYNLLIYYHTLESDENEMSTSERNVILREAVQMTVTMRILEEETAARGYVVASQTVAQAAREDEEVFDKTYTGGFKTFCEHWNLSENVFVTVNKYEALMAIAKEYFFDTEEVTEEEALEYYEAHEEEFMQKPHFEVREIYLQVLNPADESAKEAVYNDANFYIEMLNSGKSWQNVADTAAIKYNLDRGMVFSHYLTGAETVYKEDFDYVTSFNSAINDINEKFKKINGVSYEEMFPNGFDAYIAENEIEEGSQAYKDAFEAHMNYWSERYYAEFNYAITAKWETGKTYQTPIYHGGYNCYVVLTFSSIEEDEGELSFEEAKADIIAMLTDERKEEVLENFISRKMDAANVQINYD